MCLITDLENKVNKYVKKFISKIVEQNSSFTKSELMTMWTGVSLKDKKSKGTRQVSDSPSDSSESPSVSPSVAPSSAQSSNNTGVCPYVFIKGDKKGTSCAVKIKDSSSRFCALHKKAETQEPKERKILPKPLMKNVTSKPSSPPRKDVQRVLILNKDLNMHLHQETGFAFKTLDGNPPVRVVVGKYDGKVVVGLTPEDIELCKQWQFRFEVEGAKTDGEDDDDVKAETRSSYLTNEGKFYEMKLSGSNLSTHYGKIGSSGHTKTKLFENTDDALKEMNKTVSKKKSEGYQSKDTELKKPVEDSDDDETAPAPTPKKPVAKPTVASKKPVEDSDDDSDDDETAPAPTPKKPVVKPTVASKKPVEDSDDDETAPAPTPKKPVAKVTPAKKPVKPSEDSDDEPAPSVKKRPVLSSDSDDDCVPATKVVESSSDDSSDEEDMSKLTKKFVATTLGMDDDSTMSD